MGENIRKRNLGNQKAESGTGKGAQGSQKQDKGLDFDCDLFAFCIAIRAHGAWKLIKKDKDTFLYISPLPKSVGLDYELPC